MFQNFGRCQQPVSGFSVLAKLQAGLDGKATNRFIIQIHLFRLPILKATGRPSKKSASLLELMPDIGRYMSQRSSPIYFPLTKKGSECQQKIKTDCYFGLLQDTHPEPNVVAATTWGRDVPATNNEVASWIATGAMVEHLGRTTWHMSSTGGNIFCYPSSHHLAKIRKIK